jgi:hypothetical protein
VGGTYNPATGQIQWEFRVPIDEQLRYYAAHPPRALAALQTRRVEIEHMFDGHGEPVNVVFAITCPCGSDRFVALGHWSDGEDRFGAPISVECTQCEACHEIYDQSKHGYSGALGNNRDIPVPPPEDLDEIPAAGVAPPYAVLVRLEYPSEQLGDSQLPAEAAELFSWITVLAQDRHSRQLITLFDEECE